MKLELTNAVAAEVWKQFQTRSDISVKNKHWNFFYQALSELRASNFDEFPSVNGGILVFDAEYSLAFHLSQVRNLKLSIEGLGRWGISLRDYAPEALDRYFFLAVLGWLNAGLYGQGIETLIITIKKNWTY